MSSDLVESIHVRLREEIDRCGLSLAAASRKAGEPSSQRLKDVVSGRQKCSADLVAKLVVVGVDALYVLTAQRAPATPNKLAPDEEVLIESYRALNAIDKRHLLASVLTGAPAKKPSKPEQGTKTQHFHAAVAQAGQGDIHNGPGFELTVGNGKKKN